MSEVVNEQQPARTQGGPGTLYLCGTPIGNLEDVSQRVLRILRSVHTIAAEDTRHTRKLLSAYDIHTPLVSLHEHNEAARTPEVLRILGDGHDVALVSDAGMPGISDPGVYLVRACVAEGIPVVSVPGPSAFLTALAASGLPTERFTFEGFLPRRRKERRERLSQVRDLPHTLIFYEAPHRLRSALDDMREVLGDRWAVLARELTKLHEEYIRGPLSRLIEWCSTHAVRGEFVILVAGASPERVRAEAGDEELHEMLRRLLGDGMSVRDAVRTAAERLGVSKRRAYDVALRIEEEV